MQEPVIQEKTSEVFLPEQNSAIRKAIFINWLLNYAKAYPEKFPEKEGRIIHQKMGDHALTIPVLSREEILAWHNTNRPDNHMTAEEFEAIMVIQKQNGLLVIGNCFYTLLV